MSTILTLDTANPRAKIERLDNPLDSVQPPNFLFLNICSLTNSIENPCHKLPCHCHAPAHNLESNQIGTLLTTDIPMATHARDIELMLQAKIDAGLYPSMDVAIKDMKRLLDNQEIEHHWINNPETIAKIKRGLSQSDVGQGSVFNVDNFLTQARNYRKEQPRHADHPKDTSSRR